MSDASIDSKEVIYRDLPAAIEYARRLYDDVLGWYESADVKAQVLLGLDGAFLVFLATAALQNPTDVEKVIAKFTPWTWRLLALMSASLIISMGAAISCLWSRIKVWSSLADWISEAKPPARGPDKYPAGVMWFFQHVAALDSPQFRTTLRDVDKQFEMDAMASQIEKLADNVKKKHIAVDLGFVLLVAAVLFFTLAAGSYVYNLRMS